MNQTANYTSSTRKPNENRMSCAVFFGEAWGLGVYNIGL